MSPSRLPEVAEDLERLLADMRAAAGEQGWINHPMTQRLARCIVDLRDGEADPPTPGSDAAEWRDTALQAIRAADLLAEATIDRLDAGNEYRINEALEVLYGIPGYWQLSKRAAA